MMRINELHPALVHFPIAFLPATLGADALGRVTGSWTLQQVGRWGMALTAGSGLVAGLAGLVAQESSRFDADTRDILVTHRNLNLAAVGLTAWMAARRARRDAPTIPYLLLGLAALGTVSYSAYLGGHMAYEHGVGVKEAGGLKEEEAPHLDPAETPDVLRAAARHLTTGTRDLVAEIARGNLLPWLARAGHAPAGRPDVLPPRRTAEAAPPAVGQP